MTNEEAIKVLLDEWKCIDRNDGINCDRKCESCDLVMDTFVLKDAYNTAIKALETIPKYKDAYNKGWDDGAKATNIDCGVVWEERIDAIKADIDKQTEIHSDGEFYIKNIDVKRIIDKHCGG